MTELELQHLRREKWHIDGEAVRTLEDAREFIESLGMALLFPVRPMPLLPTLIAAVAGSDHNVPERKLALGNAHATHAQELAARLVQNKLAFEAQVSSEILLLSPTVFPYYYALASDRNPRQPIRSRVRGKASPLTEHVFRAIEQRGPLTQKQLQESLGGALSEAAIARALDELWAALKITRTGNDSQNGNSWDVYYRWAPAQVEQGVRVSDAEALSALVSQYLEAVIAATEEEIEAFFSAIASRARVVEVVRALLAAREFVYTPSETRTLITVAHAAGSDSSRARGERSFQPAVSRRRNG
jgi:uncharacterized protein YcaQ